jgi:O-antigen/teichoic acid export membrane protein
MDDAATGVFSSVVRVVEGLKLGHYAVLGALLPVISRSLMDSRRSFRKAFMLLMGTSFAFAVGLVLFSKPVILILYGSEFLGAESLLALLGWSLVPYTISSFISYDLIARGREYAVVGNALLSLCVHAALYIWLIPFAGLTGATWAALAGEFFEAIVFAVSYWVIVRRGPAVDPK